MDENYQTLVKKLTEQKKTIATMETCTGGGVVNQITNIEGASEVLRFSAVTYSNEYKIKLGVPEEVIKKYSVYSMETAREMAYHISAFANSTYGIGITGKLNRVDKENPFGKDNVVFVSIYDAINKKYTDFTVEAILTSRKENKNLVLETLVEQLLKVIN